MPNVYSFPAKKIFELEYFQNWLKEQGYAVAGLYRKDAGVAVEGPSDPSALVAAYVNPNQYEMVVTSGIPDEGGMKIPNYPVYKVSVGADVTFRIRKIRGLDGAVMPDADTLDIHWHLPPSDQPKTITLVNGEAFFVVHQMKRCWGFAEAVPTGSVDIKVKLPSLIRGGVTLWAC
jgi:hypothetical protein